MPCDNFKFFTTTFSAFHVRNPSRHHDYYYSGPLTNEVASWDGVAIWNNGSAYVGRFYHGRNGGFGFGIGYDNGMRFESNGYTVCILSNGSMEPVKSRKF